MRREEPYHSPRYVCREARSQLGFAEVKVAESFSHDGVSCSPVMRLLYSGVRRAKNNRGTKALTYGENKVLKFDCKWKLGTFDALLRFVSKITAKDVRVSFSCEGFNLFLIVKTVEQVKVVKPWPNY